jgi:hypothetical protein
MLNFFLIIIFFYTKMINLNLCLDVYSLKSVQQQYSYPANQNVVNVNKKLVKQKEITASTPCCNL